MIPKGLKVGETYLEGNLVYRVTKVVSDNIYEGTWTGEISSGSLPVEQPKEEAIEENALDYNSLPYATLKKMCAERGLDATGKKDDLVARLEG